MSFKDSRRRKYSKKKKYKKPRCEKEEYFNKKTGICKTKTKRSKRPSKRKKSKRKKKVSEPLANSLTNSLTNSSNVFEPSIINSVPKKTRIFLILVHSNLCSYRELQHIKSGRKDTSKRLDLKNEAIIKDIDNLKVVNIQSIGLNSTALVYSLVNFLNENEKFHSAFIQMNSIEKAEILDKFMKYLFLQTKTIGRFTLS